MSLTVARASDATRARYEVRLGGHPAVVGRLCWHCEALRLISAASTHGLTLHGALDGVAARLGSLDLEYGFTMYGPSLALTVERASGE